MRRLEGSNVKSAKSKWDAVLEVREDIQRFKADNRVERLVMIWCGSTEIFMEHHEVHQLGREPRKSHPRKPPGHSPEHDLRLRRATGRRSLSKRRAELDCGCPAMIELARQKGVPVGGKDFKTGQTLMKTLLAPGLKARMLGVQGWFSTNILGNRDGEVLDDPDSFKTKEVSKLDVLEFILQPNLYPQLYGDIYHKVRINYYPPRGDEKEGWDNIDIFGWLGMPMQIKVDFLCRDSILAAPLVLDLVLFADLAQRAQMAGDPRVALVLLQKPDDRAPTSTPSTISYPANEAQKHAALLAGRRPNYPLGARVLRLGTWAIDMAAHDEQYAGRHSERHPPRFAQSAQRRFDKLDVKIGKCPHIKKLR